MDNQQSPTVYSTGNFAQCYVAACMGGKFEGELIHVCVCVYVCIYIYIYIYIYGWVPFPPAWNYYNIVNRLHSNVKQKVKKKRKPLPGKPTWNLSFLHMSHLFSLCGPAVNLSLLQTKVSLLLYIYICVCVCVCVYTHTHSISSYTHTHRDTSPNKNPSTHVFKAVFCRPLPYPSHQNNK